MLNREADEFSRGVVVAALALLAVWAEVPRVAIIEYFRWLAREGLERVPGYVWSALAAESADIEALAVFPELRRAYDDGLINPQVVGRSELDEVERLRRGDLLEDTIDRYPPIDDVAEATAWWARFGRYASSRRAEELAAAAAGRWARTWRPSRTAFRQRSGAMSRARVAAARSTRSAAETERRRSPVNVSAGTCPSSSSGRGPADCSLDTGGTRH